MVRKIALTLTFLFSLLASASTFNLDDVNAAIKEIFAQFNDNLTSVAVTLQELTIDEELTRHVLANGNFTKLGTYNRFDLQIPHVEYRFDNGGIPTLTARLDLNLDILKAFGHNQLNNMAANAAQMVKDYVNGLTRDYGDAATTDAAVDVAEHDSDGNVTHLKMHLSGKLDLSKLPPGKAPDQEFLIGGELIFEVNLNEAHLDWHSEFNPDYAGFNKGQEGFKAFVERLLARDKDTVAEITQYVTSIDDIASDLVERDGTMSSRPWSSRELQVMLGTATPAIFK